MNPVLGQNGNAVKEETDPRKIWEEKLLGFGDGIGNVSRGRRKNGRESSGLQVFGYLEKTGASSSFKQQVMSFIFNIFNLKMGTCKKRCLVSRWEKRGRSWLKMKTWGEFEAKKPRHREAI